MMLKKHHQILCASRNVSIKQLTCHCQITHLSPVLALKLYPYKNVQTILGQTKIDIHLIFQICKAFVSHAKLQNPQKTQNGIVQELKQQKDPGNLEQLANNNAWGMSG